MESLEAFCRLCLSPEEVEVSLFDIKNGYWAEISEMFRIKLKRQKGWPALVCKSCIQVLDDMRSLKVKIQHSEKKLIVVRDCAEFFTETTEEEPATSKEPKSTILKAKSPSPDVSGGSKRRATRSSKRLEQPEGVDEVLPVDSPPGGLSMSMEDNDNDDDAEESVDDNIGTRVEDESSAKKRRNRRIEDHPYDEMMHSMDILRCQLCPEKFQKYGELTRHCGSVHSCKPNVICCNRSFPKIQLSDHMLYHLDNNSFVCTLCNKNFLSGQLLERHNSTRHQMGDSQYKCSVCDHKFRAPNLLKIHMTKHTEKSLRPEFKCQHCSKVFTYETSLKSHIQRTHEESQTEICETCGKGFASKWLLNMHHKTHDIKTAERCDICFKYFANLRNHKQKVHTEKDLVECTECGKMISPTYLKVHVKEYHGERKEIPCDICGKIFRNNKNLKVHMGLHLGVTYDCRFCTMKFNILGNRTKHEKNKHLKAYLELKSEQEAEKQRSPNSTIEIILLDEDTPNENN